NMIMVIGPTKKKAEAKAEARRSREHRAELSDGAAGTLDPEAAAATEANAAQTEATAAAE
ncbi:MAG: translation initiation factor IF-3, partial [Terracoccus sp.]